jgi:integrase
MLERLTIHLSKYERLLHLYIDPYLGNTRMKDLSLPLVNRTYKLLLEKGIGASSVLYTHRILHTALEQAVKIGVLGRNPAHSATLPRREQKEMKNLSEQQVGLFLVAASASRYRSLYHLAVTTGMRISELRGLKWEDIDWSKGAIKVCRQLQEAAGKGLPFSEPKTRSGYRTIKVGETTLRDLQEHRQRMAVERAVAGSNWSENDLIFTSNRGTPFSQSNVYKDFRRVLAAANLPRIRIHDLRHTAASLMLNRGIPVLVVSKRLGHSNPSVTLNVYAHTSVDMQNEAASLMDEIVTPIPVEIPGAEATTQDEKSQNHLHPIAPE